LAGFATIRFTPNFGSPDPRSKSTLTARCNAAISYYLARTRTGRSSKSRRPKGVAGSGKSPACQPRSLRLTIRAEQPSGRNMKLHRRRILQLAGAAAGLPFVTSITRAQTYPTRPVRFIVPLAAGGGNDFVARLTADYLSRSLGQQFIVENKVGAGGLLGIETVARSLPDGYTVLVTADAIVSTPHIVTFNVDIVTFNVDYVRTLLPVSHLVRSPQTISVHPSLGVSTLAELIDLAKRRPGIGYATSGAGTNQNFLGEWFAQAA